MNLETKIEKGVVFGVFDILHIGHIKMFEWAKQHVDYLVVGVNRGEHLAAHKNKPILTAEERVYLVTACKYVDEAFIFDREEDLHAYQAEHLDYARIIGSDHKESFSGSHLPIERILVHNRSHSYSSSEMRRRIAKAES
jgi:glycerol-3-phosphate cytidylyltransferase